MGTENRNIVKEKTFDFALLIVQQVKICQESHKEYVLTKQLLRSGTSIGAMVVEAEHAESKKDFIHKMSIGLKEANETRYWVELLYASKHLNEGTFHELHDKITEIIKLLASIVKSSKQNI